MPRKDTTSCRGMLEVLRKDKGELLVIDGPVDPILEVSGLTKALDDGPALLFENVKRYPGHRILTNPFSRAERVARIFGIADYRKLKVKGVQALKNPLPPKIVDGGPCQEVVVTRDIDVPAMMPIIKHTATDPGRIIGGGNILLSGPDMGYCISFRRTHFRGADWASMAFTPGTHLEYWALESKKRKKTLPLTINITTPPAVMCVSAGGIMQATRPVGSDELGVAGAIQGKPVTICKAKTVDAYAIADSEWVIEGYLDPSKVVYESEEAETREDLLAPYFPEYYGYQGRARPTYRFQATAVTRRKDNPIFYSPIAHCFEYTYMQSLTNQAMMLEFLNRMSPGLVIDVNVLQSMKGWCGMIIQVNKRRRRDEEAVKNLILAPWVASTAIRMVVVVDEDVDIYNAEEIVWALNTRVNPKEDIIMVPPGVRFAGLRGEMKGPTAPMWRMGFDATAPYEEKEYFFRGEYPSVDLSKWLTKEQIAGIQAQQSDYAKVLAEKRA